MVRACLFVHTVWPLPAGLGSSIVGSFPDISSWSDSGRSGSRGRPDIGSWPDSGRVAEQSRACRQSDTTGDGVNTEEGGGGCGSASEVQLSICETG